MRDKKRDYVHGLLQKQLPITESLPYNLIRKGEKAVLCYASANRDEEVFSNPVISS
jgi:cytochrome P450